VGLEVDHGGGIDAADEEAGGRGREGEPVVAVRGRLDEPVRGDGAVGMAGEEEAVGAARREVGEERRFWQPRRGLETRMGRRVVWGRRNGRRYRTNVAHGLAGRQEGGGRGRACRAAGAWHGDDLEVISIKIDRGFRQAVGFYFLRTF